MTTVVIPRQKLRIRPLGRLATRVGLAGAVRHTRIPETPPEV